MMIKQKWITYEVEELCEALLELRDKEEAELFMRDLLTLKEIKDLAERLQIAKKVSQGYSYREIARKLGVSTTTVTRVAHWLKNGVGGFSMIVERLEKKRKAKSDSDSPSCTDNS